MISIMSSVQKPGDYLDYHFLIIHDIHEPRISTSKGVDLDGERQFSWQLEKTPVTCQELGEISIRWVKWATGFPRLLSTFGTRKLLVAAQAAWVVRGSASVFATPQMAIVKWNDIPMMFQFMPITLGMLYLGDLYTHTYIYIL